jgi:hypothetical protein
LVLFGDVEARPISGLVFPKESAGVDFAAL